VQVKDFGKKGQGLVANEDIKAGDFVIEYIGEIIDRDEMDRRAEANDGKVTHHYYFDLGRSQAVAGSEFIDAKNFGNVARFINHSCDPNLQSQVWNVLAEKCVGFFALRDIKNGEELSFDYQFKVFNKKERQRCLCGAENCRGWLDGSLKKESKKKKKVKKKSASKKKKWVYKPMEIMEDKEERLLYNSFLLVQNVFSSEKPSALQTDLRGLWGSKFCNFLGHEKGDSRLTGKKAREELRNHVPEKLNLKKLEPPHKHQWMQSFQEEVSLSSIFGNKAPEPPGHHDPIEDQARRLTNAIAAASGPAPDDIQPARINAKSPPNAKAVIENSVFLKMTKKDPEEDNVDIVNKTEKPEKPAVDLLASDEEPRKPKAKPKAKSKARNKTKKRKKPKKADAGPPRKRRKLEKEGKDDYGGHYSDSESSGAKRRKLNKKAPEGGAYHSDSDSSDAEFIQFPKRNPTPKPETKPPKTSVASVAEVIEERPPPPPNIPPTKPKPTRQSEPKPQIRQPEPIQIVIEKALPDTSISPSSTFWCFHCEREFIASKAAIKQIEHDCFISPNSKKSRLQRWRCHKAGDKMGFMKKCKFTHVQSHFCIISIEDYRLLSKPATEQAKVVEQDPPPPSSISPKSQNIIPPEVKPIPTLNDHNLTSESHLKLLPCMASDIVEEIRLLDDHKSISSDWDPELDCWSSDDLAEEEQEKKKNQEEEQEKKKNQEEEMEIEKQITVLCYQGHKNQKGRSIPISPPMIFSSIAKACKPASLSDKDIQVENVNEMSGRISFEVRILNPEKETIIRKLKLNVRQFKCTIKKINVGVPQQG